MRKREIRVRAMVAAAKSGEQRLAQCLRLAHALKRRGGLSGGDHEQESGKCCRETHLSTMAPTDLHTGQRARHSPVLRQEKTRAAAAARGVRAAIKSSKKPAGGGPSSWLTPLTETASPAPRSSP
jgi:hypothetical protein